MLKERKTETPCRENLDMFVRFYRIKWDDVWGLRAGQLGLFKGEGTHKHDDFDPKQTFKLTTLIADKDIHFSNGFFGRNFHTQTKRNPLDHRITYNCPNCIPKSFSPPRRAVNYRF